MEENRNVEMDDRTYTVVEMCPHCMNEIEMTWDTDTRGFKATCPVCGGRLMLCDECMHAEEGLGCDYNSETDTCRHNRGYSAGCWVRVWNLPDEKPDGAPYTGTEPIGKITECLGNDTFLVAMADGEKIMIKKENLA